MRPARCASLVFIFAAVASAQLSTHADPAISPIDPDALHLRTGVVALAPNQSLHRAATAAPINATGNFVIQLDGPLTPQHRSDLARAGVTLGDYLPANAYIVRLPAGFAPRTALANLPFVRWVGPFEKSWKLDPDIGSRNYTTGERQLLAARNQLKLTVVLFAGEDLGAAVAQLGNLPGAIVIDAQPSGDHGVIEFSMPATAYKQLADFASIQWIEEAPEITQRNDTNRWIVQTNVANSTTVWDHGIHGENQIGGHIDGGIRQDHCSFSDPNGNPIGPTHRKIVAYFGSTSPDQHGTHTAGSFLGDEQPVAGTSTYRGIAYMAKVAFTNLSTVTGANTLSKLTQDHNAGARVHSNSWGTDGTTAYNTQVRDIDLFSVTNEDDLVLVAVTDANHAVYTPENAKNCMGVTLTNDTPNQGSQCFGIGFAPTADGRRKPDICAPGCSTWSSNSATTCGFTNIIFGGQASGSSMACPVVAGAALLVRQYYMDGFYPTGAANSPDGFTPSGALVKATLINSAVDMSGISGFPSVREGWGRVLLENALYFAGDARRLVLLDDLRNASGLTTGQNRVYNLNVTDSAQPLKITLVWTEKEASVSANPAYINNLNLVVADPSANTYLGNVFSGNQSVTGGSADLVNNVEQVLLSSPPVGAYTVTITAPVVNTPGPQGFALIATGAISVTLPGPSVTAITPNTGETDSIVSVTDLAGTNFQPGATFKLARTSFADIPATGINVVSSGQLSGSLDLTNAESGPWDVVVTNPDTQSATLAGGFTITVTCMKGDVNQDGFVDGQDIAKFVEVLLLSDGTVRQRCSGDLGVNRDAQIQVDDIPAFIDCLLTGACS